MADSNWDPGKIFWFIFAVFGGITMILIGIRTGETLLGIFISCFFWIPAIEMVIKQD